MNPFVALDPLKTSKYEAGGMATILFFELQWLFTSSNAISSPKVGSSSRFVSEVGRSEISRFERFSGLHPYLTAVYTEPLPFLQLRSVFACWSFTLPAINRSSRPWHLRKGGLSCAASKDDSIENQCTS